MPRFVILTFGFLFLAVYALSGGPDFEPGPNTTARALGLAGSDRSAAAAPDPAVAAAAPPAKRADPAPDLGITLATLDSRDIDEPAALRPVSEAAPEDMTPEALAPKGAEPMAPKGAEPMAPKGAEPQGPAAQADPPDTAGVRGAGSAVDPRRVNGSRVNLRAGPGTANPVLAKLDKGDLVEVLENSGDGWLRIRMPGTGVVGWMADFLVTAGTD